MNALHRAEWPPVEPEPRRRHLAVRLLRGLAAGLGILLLTALVAVLVLVAVLPFVSPYRFTIVAGGSMEPTIPYGSVSVVRELEAPRTLQPGDIIQYISPSNGFVTTHRIVALAPDGASFETRGDANNVADSDPVPFRNIQGRYEFHVPYVGEGMQWLRSPWGYAVMVVVPGVLLILLEVRRMFRALRAARAANR